MSPYLRAQAVRVLEDGVARVGGLDLAVPEHGLHLLLGASGSGKSALIEALVTGRNMTAGRIFLGDVEITGTPASARRRLGLACAFQRPPLIPGLTLDEHLAIAATGNAGSLALDAIFGLLPECRDSRHQPVERLDRSGRRLADLARALASRPKLLVIDDIAQDLAIERTLELFQGLRRLGLTLLVADRYARPLLALASTASVLVRGQIAIEGEASALIGDEDTLAASIGDLPAES